MPEIPFQTGCAPIGLQTIHEAKFRPEEINFAPRRNGHETQGCNHSRAINNGVDSMTRILGFIYREYCRSCFLSFKYL